MMIPSTGPRPLPKLSAGSTNGKITYVKVHRVAEINIDRWNELYASWVVDPAGASLIRSSRRTKTSAADRGVGAPWRACIGQPDADGSVGSGNSTARWPACIGHPAATVGDDVGSDNSGSDDRVSEPGGRCIMRIL